MHKLSIMLLPWLLAIHGNSLQSIQDTEKEKVLPGLRQLFIKTTTAAMLVLMLVIPATAAMLVPGVRADGVTSGVIKASKRGG